MGIPHYIYNHPYSDNLIVGTKSNVVALLDKKDGSIIWRQLMPKGCSLNHMSIFKSSDNPSDFLVRTSCSSPVGDKQLIWEPRHGLLVSESRYKDFLEDDQATTVVVDSSHEIGETNVFTLNDETEVVVRKDGLVEYKLNGQIVWSKEESLATVVAADILKLPLDSRDKFGFKKMIVLVTETGKIFGMETFTGQVIWQLFDEDLAANGQSHALLIPSRQSDESADESRALVVHPSGLVLCFNPITGEMVEKKRLQNPIKQVAQTALQSDGTRGVLILDIEDQVQVYPDSILSDVKRDISKYYMTLAEQDRSQLIGYKFKVVANKIVSEKIWEYSINESEKILQIGNKRIGEVLHSPARVLGDRGILYKYVNPNLLAIMTEGTFGEPCSPESSINIYLIDGVTGALVHSIHQPKSRSPAKLLHSENWILYSYYNTKARRTEVSSLEMFEGVTQTNSTAFSSLARSQIKPKLIEHKSFIFPNGIDAMIDTVTLRGMTNKHVIVALPTGALLEIPKIFLDPRRPINMMMEHREEGLVPYMPELPLPSESMINYHQTLLGIRDIVTSPAQLESTCLVFAYGLDLFFTRVSPSKTFDILKDDFDHVLISSVLVFLVVASFATKHLAQRKALRAAWK